VLSQTIPPPDPHVLAALLTDRAVAETGAMTLWPVAQILGDLACYLCLPGREAHYRDALAIAERTRVELWREAAVQRLAHGTG
jgi:hypothetical protein